MKKVIYSLVFALGLMGFTSCDYDGDDDSKITYYVSIELTGGSQTLVPVGSAYTDPGYTATEGTEDVTKNVVIGGDEVDANTVGVYTVTYSAKNVDGFEKSVSRDVIVYDPSITTDLAGTYATAAGTYRDRAGTITDYAGYTVNITKVANGLFIVDDMLGGYYSLRAGYGSSYALKAYVKLNADNTMSFISGGVSGWGDTADYVEDFKYDPETGQVSACVGYAGMDFYIVLAK